MPSGRPAMTGITGQPGGAIDPPRVSQPRGESCPFLDLSGGLAFGTGMPFSRGLSARFGGRHCIRLHVDQFLASWRFGWKEKPVTQMARRRVVQVRTFQGPRMCLPSSLQPANEPPHHLHRQTQSSLQMYTRRVHPFGSPDNERHGVGGPGSWMSALTS